MGSSPTPLEDPRGGVLRTLSALLFRLMAEWFMRLPVKECFLQCRFKSCSIYLINQKSKDLIVLEYKMRLRKTGLLEPVNDIIDLPTPSNISY